MLTGTSGVRRLAGRCPRGDAAHHGGDLRPADARRMRRTAADRPDAGGRDAQGAGRFQGRAGRLGHRQSARHPLRAQRRSVRRQLRRRQRAGLPLRAAGRTGAACRLRQGPEPALRHRVLSGRQAEWVYIAESDGLKRYPYKDGDIGGRGRAARRSSRTFPRTPLDARRRVLARWQDDVLLRSARAAMSADGTMETPAEGGLEHGSSDHPLGVAWGAEERRAAVLAVRPRRQERAVSSRRACATAPA